MCKKHHGFVPFLSGFVWKQMLTHPRFLPESRDAVIARHRQSKAAIPESSDIEDDDGIRPELDDDNTILASMIGQFMEGKGLDGVGSTLEANPEKGRKKNGEPRKSRAPVPKTARERFDYDQAKDLEKQREKERKKLQKKKADPPASASSSKSKSKSKSKGKGKESAKSSAKTKKAAKKGKGKEKVVKNGPSLLHGSHNWKDGEDTVAEGLLRALAQSDPISERLSNPIFKLGAEPELHGRMQKNTQFSKLFANIPEGASISNAKNDKKILLKASKSFGNRQVTAVNGKWHLRGMKETSALYHHQLLGTEWMLSREFADVAPHGKLQD